ncbi:MAG: DUF3060 domain-containing protein [Janthinobacterium lividum]
MPHRNWQLSFGALSFLLCGVCFAQREVPMPAYISPSPIDAVVSGDRLSRTITCRDRVPVYVHGAGNEVQLYGDCGIVRILGSRNFVWMDREAQVVVNGADNMIYIRTSTTKISVHGSGNRFELRR